LPRSAGGPRQGGVDQKIADELIAAKGVKHGKLTVTTTGKEWPV
jgi:hypothetical protein